MSFRAIRNGSVPLFVLMASVPISIFGQGSFSPPKLPAGTSVKTGSGPGATAPVSATAPPPGVGGLLGSTLQWQYYAYGGPYDGPSDFVVNGGEGGAFPGYFSILAGANSITFNYSIYNGATPPTWNSSPISLPPTIHNGIAINMEAGPAFLEVGIDPATNMVGFDASRISFTGNQIQVDWENLSFTTDTIVKLDVITPGAQVCEQDQYGNQYNFVFDATEEYVYGTVTNAQGCSSKTWNLIGSFSKAAGGLGLALTAANPTPTDGCSSMYTLSGTYPSFEWLYQTGADDPQNSTYVACGTAPSNDATGRGSLK